MKNGIRSKNKKSIFIVLIFLLTILILFCLFKVFDLKKYFIPIYQIEDRTSNVKKVKKKYEDESVIGWLRVQGTNIDYPIIENYGDVKEKEFDYLWTNNHVENLTDYLAIYGHNIRNVSSQPIVGNENMNKFEQLMSYMYYDFNQDNKYIQYTVGNKNYLYQIFSLAIVPSYKIDNTVTSYTKKEKEKKIKDSIRDSYFKFDVDVSTNDEIISLVTCTRFNGIASDNFKIDAKLVENGKKGYNYSVLENENYKSIKKILEGDGEDA